MIAFQVISGVTGFSILLEKLLSLGETVTTVQEWVRGAVLGSRLVAVIEEVCTTGQKMDSHRAETGWNILSLALSTSKQGGVSLFSLTFSLLALICHLLITFKNSFDQNRTDRKSVLIWIQTV